MFDFKIMPVNNWNIISIDRNHDTNSTNILSISLNNMLYHARTKHFLLRKEPRANFRPIPVGTGQNPVGTFFNSMQLNRF